MGAKELLKDIDVARKNWNERSCFKLKGISNLSVSDLDVLELYGECYLTKGNYDTLMRPMGDIAKVLAGYGLKNENRRSIFRDL